MSVTTLTVFTQGGPAVTPAMLNTFQQTCDTVAQLRTLVGLPGMQVSVRGNKAAGDGGGGTYYWSATSATPDNGNTIIVPFGVGFGAWVLLTVNDGSVINSNPNNFFPGYSASATYPDAAAYAALKLNPIGQNICVLTTGGGTIDQQPIPWTNGTALPLPNGIVAVRYRLVGGGGASGGTGGKYGPTVFGAGGGGGGYAAGVLNVAGGTLITITVGTGGVPDTTSPYPGGDGGTTYLGTTIGATGGKGGGVATPQSTNGGAGGLGFGGQVNGVGNYGGDGQNGQNYPISGRGGSSALGGGGRAAQGGGLPGGSYGGGAGGTYQTSDLGSSGSGNVGADGVVILVF